MNDDHDADVVTAQGGRALHHEARCLMNELRTRILPQEGWPQTGNVTLAFLAHVSAESRGPLQGEETFGLERLCHKIEVHGVVRTAYDAQWRRALDMRALATDDWPFLVLCLLQCGLEAVEQSPEGRGLALKWLNAAFRATDIYRATGGKAVPGTISRFMELRLRELTT